MRSETKRRPRIKGRGQPTTKAPRATRKRQNLHLPVLTQLLSELTKDYRDLPVKNMEKWVNRSAEERKLETEKRKGYVTRPMNSFFLYRAAFAERTKAWCLRNNCNVVSAVSGLSWPLEPPEIRALYIGYAVTERKNHRQANPEYKFSPGKQSPICRGEISIKDSDIAGEGIPEPRPTDNNSYDGDEDMDTIQGPDTSQGPDTTGVKSLQFGYSKAADQDCENSIFGYNGLWYGMDCVTGADLGDMGDPDFILHHYCSLRKLCERRELEAGYLDDGSHHEFNFDLDAVFITPPGIGVVDDYREMVGEGTVFQGESFCNL